MTIQTESVKLKRKELLEAFHVIRTIMNRRSEKDNPKEAEHAEIIRKEFSPMYLALRDLPNDEAEETEKLRMQFGTFDDEKKAYTVSPKNSNEYKKFKDAYKKWLDKDQQITFSNKASSKSFLKNKIYISPEEQAILGDLCGLFV